MTAPPVTTLLSVDHAQVLVGSIRASFEKAWEHYADGCQMLVEAYQGKAWLALGLADWEAFVTHTLDVDHLKIPRAERKQIVSALRDGGLTVREIAAATGLGIGTVHRELPVPNGTDRSQCEHEYGFADALIDLQKAAEAAEAYSRLETTDSQSAVVAFEMVLDAARSLQKVIDEAWFPVHPALALIPEFEGPTFDAFVESIRTHGLMVDIVVTEDGEVLDGRARLRACSITGTRPRFKVYEGDDPVGYTMSANLIRTHLSEEQLAAAEIGANALRSTLESA